MLVGCDEDGGGARHNRSSQRGRPTVPAEQMKIDLAAV
jgi:hypothetical protein